MKAEKLAYELGYRVDEDGNVLGKKVKFIKPNKDEWGYYYFSVRPIKKMNMGRKLVSVMIHRLVAYQFFGDALYEPGIEVRHLDNNEINNSKANIAIGTKTQNAYDKTPETRKRVGKAGAAILRSLTFKQAQELRADRVAGWNYKELEEKYKICKSSISYIVNNKLYKEE